LGVSASLRVSRGQGQSPNRVERGDFRARYFRVRREKNFICVPALAVTQSPEYRSFKRVPGKGNKWPLGTIGEAHGSEPQF
jgi:hypothetical protein